MSLDYVSPEFRGENSEKIDPLPILVGVDGLSRKSARMVPENGLSDTQSRWWRGRSDYLVT